MADDKQKLRGFMKARVVGMRLMPDYDPADPPHPNVKDVIYLEREPNNPVDPTNSLLIKHNSQYIGYLACEPASELASLIDGGTISVRGVVAADRWSRSEKSFPCQILVFSATRSLPLNFNSKLLSPTTRNGFMLDFKGDENFNLRKFDEWAVGQGGAQVPPLVQVSPPTPVQVSQPMATMPPVQVQEPIPTGETREETTESIFRALRDLIDRRSGPREKTGKEPNIIKTVREEEEPNIIKTVRDMGFDFGRAPFWGPDVPDLGT